MIQRVGELQSESRLAVAWHALRGRAVTGPAAVQRVDESVSFAELGFLRPFIGATFALVLYIAVKSNLLELGNVAKPGIYFFATVSFLAGFSERHAKVLLGNVAGGVGTGETRK